jgi:hypothetical protein
LAQVAETESAFDDIAVCTRSGAMQELAENSHLGAYGGSVAGDGENIVM